MNKYCLLLLFYVVMGFLAVKYKVTQQSCVLLKSQWPNSISWKGGKGI